LSLVPRAAAGNNDNIENDAVDDDDDDDDKDNIAAIADDNVVISIADNHDDDRVSIVVAVTLDYYIDRVRTPTDAILYRICLIFKNMILNQQPNGLLLHYLFFHHLDHYHASNASSVAESFSI